MGAFEQILEKYRAEASSERDKGDKFERLMLRFLQTAPEYRGLFSHVWLWAEFPYKMSFGSGKDIGIDIVCQNMSGEFWAVQCKCYKEEASINKPAVDSFLSTSSKLIELPDGKKVPFVHRLWISTTKTLGSEAENAFKDQQPPVSHFLLSSLENSPVDWEKLDQGLMGREARIPQKKPMPHQLDAIKACEAYFSGAADEYGQTTNQEGGSEAKHKDEGEAKKEVNFREKGRRGKLVMACGTGKTFTALKVAEQQAGVGGLVLFLAPSIALVGQTLHEWMSDSSVKIHPLCVCSDPKISQKRMEDSLGESVIELALPATTDVEKIVKELTMCKEQYPDSMVVVFSTYQSIGVVAKAQELFGRAFDLAICDEAHRTTGITLANEDESSFVMVHDNTVIRAVRRLYMTATPRLYASSAKKRAKEADAVLCSMDDEKLYGKEIYRLGFGRAVNEKLLTDYKVLVFTVSNEDVLDSLGDVIASTDNEITTGDAAKLIGCVNALSKRMLIDEGLLKDFDPEPMRRAVAFCQTIKKSCKIAGAFNRVKAEFFKDVPPEKTDDVEDNGISAEEMNTAEDKKAQTQNADIIVDVVAEQIDGTMSAPQRDRLLTWLKETPESSNECRILTNVRCLSEGVDVPSLDAVLFLAAKNSQIDVVQSVGRVMRKAPGKKYGYIVIPVLLPSNVSPEEALNDDKVFDVVWKVLNALRAHDERFEAVVNTLDVSVEARKKVLIGRLTEKDKIHLKRLPLPKLKEWQEAVYARMVQKVGTRCYWEQWAKSVGDIAQRYIERIRRLVSVEGEHKETFDALLKELRESINPAVDAEELIEMLAQHVVTKPVFEALFENYSFVESNPVSKALDKMVKLLEAQAFGKDRDESDTAQDKVIADIRNNTASEDKKELEYVSQNVQRSVTGIKSAGARQQIILQLYDKFFRYAFRRTTEKLGIVYTPVEIVDFINRSVADLLQATFGRSLSDENVHVLDPFTGTGTFIARMLETGLIRQDALPRKYAKELHANEIVLLAYYIASINIENMYHAARGAEGPYEPFPGICLTDTFQLGEGGDLTRHFPQLAENSERAEAQRKTPIQVIIGNPPYSVGQKSANDNAQNQSYPALESRIASTYAAGTKATNKNALYDSYIKAFRWASDRIDKQTGGIIAFVTNAGWLDGNAMDGMRKCLEDEFSAIYVFNLRGSVRGKIGENAKREGGNVFHILTGVAITVLLKNPAYHGKALLKYFDIGDYKTCEQKLKFVEKMHSVLNPDFDWLRITADKHGDWLNQRNDIFASFIPLGDKNDKTNKNTLFVPFYSNGVKTQRDAWCWNYSRQSLIANIRKTIDYFNRKVEIKCNEIDSSYISWSRTFENDFKKGRKKLFSESDITNGLYRPFNRSFIYFSASLNEMLYQTHKLFPTAAHKNIAICVPGVGGRWLDFT